MYQYPYTADLNDISDDTVKQLCTGSHVFFDCLGTTRKQAGSAVCTILFYYEMVVMLYSYKFLLDKKNSPSPASIVFQKHSMEQIFVKAVKVAIQCTFMYRTIIMFNFVDESRW